MTGNELFTSNEQILDKKQITLTVIKFAKKKKTS